MTDAKSAWNDTGDQLTALGSKLGAHFERHRGADSEQAREETKEAIKRLGSVVQDAFQAVGDAAKDETVRQDVKSVGRSLAGALDATFREVSTEVRKRFDKDETTPATSTTPTPSTPPAPTSGPAPEYGTPSPSVDPTPEPPVQEPPRDDPSI